MQVNEQYFNLAKIQLESLVAGVEMGSEIPVQLSELRMLLTLLNEATKCE